ncbi:MAG TPA: LacI family DNA-binding transcriptional regulator [Rhodocyclaceae bacterium]|nr:LacI family DNA-binding transcriptional regulator [Rhodocyclaceae bacterium]
MDTKRRATIRDVASAADVSIATVSKFMNKLQRYSPEVEARIRHCAETLGYRRGLAIHSMATGRTRTVGMAIQDVRNPHFASLFRGASRIAATHEYSLLVVDLQENQSSALAMLEALSRRVDGLIVSSRVPDESVDWLIALNKPVVFCGRIQRQGIISVHTDSYRAAYMLGQHLIESGRRRISYLGFPAAGWNAERIRGLSDALAKKGLTPTLHETSSPSLEGGRNAATSILLEGQRPDAVVGGNDLIAIGLMHEAQSLGLRIPEDIAVAGFGDTPVASYMWPPLTTVDLRSEQQGEAAMHRLMSAILKEDTSNEVELEPHLVARASTRGRGPAV